ncbi:MAG: lyase family protein [Bacilli bacterium]
MKVRIEKDELGEKEVPYEAYYGIQTLRSKENFNISKRPISRQMIKGLSLVKKSAAYANADTGYITKDMCKAISLSCDEIYNGRLHGQFITDLVQGGSGTSMNMNVNEVIANRANEMLGQPKGSYSPIHPIDHVNFCQSTNDVVPTAGKIAAIHTTKKLLVEMKKFANAYDELAEKYHDVVTIGLTHLQESVPVTYGEIFGAIKHGIDRDIKRISSAMEELYAINLGGTVIGTGINADPKYTRRVVKYLVDFSGEPLYRSKNMIDNTRSADSFAFLSSALKMFSLNLLKNVNDLKLLSCCYNRIDLPKVQPGSPVNPGKNNPVILEMVIQVVHYIEGNDLTISRATGAGEMEFNVNMPIILASLFEELNFVRRAIRTLRVKCLSGLVVKPLKDNSIFENYILTTLEPQIGYVKCQEIGNEAEEKGVDIVTVLLEKELITKEELENFRKSKLQNQTGMVSFKEDDEEKESQK